MGILQRLFGRRQRVVITIKNLRTSLPVPSFVYAAPLDEEDIAFLRAEPISRKRMDLLWYPPEQLTSWEEPLAQRGVVTIEWTSRSEVRTHEITREDFLWAKQIERIVDEADAAFHNSDQAASIQHYKEALRLAPGCDLFLMSVGVSYAVLYQYVEGLQYLARAAQISPGIDRIRGNFDDVLNALVNTLDEQIADVLVTLLRQAESESNRDGKVHRTTSTVIKGIGDSLCKTDGKQRLNDVAQLVRIAGRSIQELELYWEGVCG